MPNVLVLDANQRSALACTRSLGSNGLRVFTADEAPRTLAGASKYSARSVVYPSPLVRPREFVEAVADLVREHDIGFLLPVTEVSLGSLLCYPELLPPDVVFPFASRGAIEHLSDKGRLFRLAEELGVPMPKTRWLDSPTQLDRCASQLEFPLVVKPNRSRFLSDGAWVSTSVSYAKDLEELHAVVARYPYLSAFPFMLQEMVEGTGRGLFTLYHAGAPFVHFGHRRLREKPPTGGVSVLSESCGASDSMIEISEKLLGHVQWDGVAMVEFIVAPDGTPYLMEVNTRFWGSLQLSIDAGVDFPYLLYQVFTGNGAPTKPKYREGVRLRWLLGDVDRLYLVLRDRSGRYRWREKMKELLEFGRPRFGVTKHEVNRLGDIGPAFHEARKYVADLFSRGA